MNELERDIALAEKIAERVSEAGGRVYYVGGFVRDRLLHTENKDIDIEVHGAAPKQLEEILDSLGERICVGESFGIYGLKGFSLDIAMPRKEKLTGRGHRDFDIFVDPFIGTRSAASRRDFTVNSMMQDVLTGEVTDCFGGREDLAAGIIRHVSRESFAEDPLRVLRGAQFAARFGFSIAEETIELCRTMDLSELAGERVEAELKKALLKADRPSVFFETLREMKQLSLWFPELEALIGTEQDPVYHPEGDVWNHTMRVLDAAAGSRDKTQYPFGFMLAALTHDFGKAVCTKTINGRIHAYGHETEGLICVESFLNRITSERRLKDYVLNLVRNHMRPFAAAQGKASVKATNRLFDDAADGEALIYIALADNFGKDAALLAEREAFLFARLSTYREYMKRPYVSGKDLKEAGFEPGEYFSELLSYAHKLRLAGVEKDSALKQTAAYAEKTAKKQI